MTRNPSQTPKDKPSTGRIVHPLRVHRVSRGLTQAELAALAGISTETVSNIERGAHRPARLTALAIASVLHLDSSDVFASDGDGQAEAGA